MQPLRALIESRLKGTRPGGDPLAAFLSGLPAERQDELRRAIPADLAGAAVLVPIVDRADGLTVLLTLRASHLKHHAGQISFPGGRIGAGESAVDAALRETKEEIGLPPAEVEVLGLLDEFLTGTGFLIRPVVGYVGHGSFVATPDPTEVAGVFEVPLGLILDPARVTTTYRERLGTRFLTYELHHAGYRIWGATAAILVNFRDVISHG